ncbi:MAG: hypothetical protein COV48_06835 [Elusimicrobia bacterium CG11_big_fil_rev_8_21_14_0_20_64_6]|nr:MAG: hypothetical protein COV48_06835 [Elusimicrobia bacterium CG11_big_fil_rev_8_21_14_0_20_64_6]
MHRIGLMPPGEEQPHASGSDLSVALIRLNEIALGNRAAYADIARLITHSARNRSTATQRLELAKSADRALSARIPATPAEAKLLYERSLREGKDGDNPDTIRHFIARAAAMRAGTLKVSPNLGKQLRPTCTLHMLRGMLSSLGIVKTLDSLAKEGRKLLNDPYVGSATAFDDALQLRLFSHYGTVVQLRERLFESIVIRRNNLKIRFEIGDPVYKHSLILEGFYELDGKIWASLRDSTSYFPTRMSLEDLGRVLTDDPALYFSEAWARPR